MFSSKTLRSYRPGQWRTLWLLLPPVYGAWLLAVGPKRVHFRLCARLLVVLTAFSILGFAGLVVLGLLSVDVLLDVLIAFQWLPTVLVWLLVLGTLVPAAVCGNVLRRQSVKRRWRCYFWPLALEALHDA